MTRACFRSCLLCLLLALSASGCELVADFDRSLIPEEMPDGGAVGGNGGGGPDGSLVPPDSGGLVPDAGPPVPDAGPPTPDAAADGATPVVDAG